MHSMAAVVLAGFSLSSPVLASPGGQEIPYERLARSVLADAGMQDSTPASFRMEELMCRAFLRSDLGLFELYVPRSALAVEARVQEYETLALALLDAQGTWLDWIEPSAGDLGELRADLASTRAWVASWASDKLAAVNTGGAATTLDLLGADDATRDASRRFAEAMGIGSMLGLSREGALSEPIVLCPEREDFVGMASLGGWLYPQHRAVFWQPAIATWAYFYVDRYKFLALELAAPGRSPGDWSSGVGMNERRPTGMGQQIVQLCTNSMLDNYFGSRVPPSFAGALATNLVIDVYGECSTRVDGDLRERRTNAIEVFVPGGNPEGGVLPPNSAESRWREGAGADHFVGVLRAAQIAGAKLRGDKKDKVGSFQLQDDSGSQRTAVHGPFLGGAASSTPTCEERFHWDRLEFLRCYRTCFVWWLQNEAESTPKKSRVQFARFLRTLAASQEGAVEAAFRTGLGAELSSAEPSRKDLEGRFQTWLSKQ